MNKYASIRNLILTALAMIFLSCVVLGYSLFGNKKSDALGHVPDTTTVGPIYDFDKNCYDAANLDALATEIFRRMNLSSSDKTLSDLITYARNTAGENGLPIKSGTMTLQYGRYRFSDQSSWKRLAWMPVYISRSTSGDAILTLYLAATSLDLSTSQQETGNFAHDGTYSTNTRNEVPSNLYSLSYMRAVFLGNLGQYATYSTPANTSDYNRLYPAKVNKSNYNKFSDFIKGTDFTGALYDDIATPSQMKWQANESYSQYIGTAGSGDIYEGKAFPNESYSTPSTGSYTSDYYNYESGTYQKKDYNLWKDDKVWLPSLTEVGTGDVGDNSVDTTNGIWRLTANQRSNTTYSWLRTANTAGNSPATMFVMDKDGHVASSIVDKNYGIRPAIHLNLSKIQSGNKTVEPINIPDVVKSPYTGEYQQIEDFSEAKRKELFPWYSADDMKVTFAYDYDFSKGTVPLNAGEYWMRVELKSSSNRYFLGSTQKGEVRKFKFVVEKAKIGVKWVYEDTTQFSPPAKVERIGNFYERDIKAQNIPEIGMLYSNVTGSGIQNSPTWPDKIGWYKAVAYIVEDNTHNYNYELSSEIEVEVDGTKVKTEKLESHQFEVLQLPVEIPCFKDYPDKDVVTLSYKGKQYIQIANVSKYVKVDVVANPQSAQENIVDLGVVDGVQTFALESVASYEFNFTLVDTLNTVWKDNGINTSYQTLTLNIDKAEITLAFEGLPSSWETARTIEFSVNILGIYTTGENSEFDLGVYWQDSSYNRKEVSYNPSSGKFYIPANTLPAGEFTMEAVINNLDQNKNYILSRAITQKFSVKETNIDFDTDWVTWNYKIGGSSSYDEYSYNSHDTESKALKLPFVENGYYEFSLRMTAGALKDKYLKAEYSGDTYVNSAGMHCVTVTISAYYKNIDFNPRTYKIYFNIEAAKFDLSGIEWDYDSASPFTYSGNEYKVKIKAETLPEGLTVVYSTGGIATNAEVNAGDYVTAAIFKVSEEYAANYLVPNVMDGDSYINDGSFSFTCSWTIEKQDIVAEWVTEDPTSDLFFVPYLKTGRTLVNYTFERKTGGSWTPCTSITSTGSNEDYRVTATINSENSNNYTLSGNTSYEFIVEAGKYAVTMHVEINDVKCDDGAQVTYTGSAFEVKPVPDSITTISTYTVDYYNATSSGTKGAKLTGAPRSVGKYIAVINSTFSTGFQSESEFNFEVIKADVDLSPLRLVYEHGDVTISARWNSDLHKWVDADGSEVLLAFEYDGTRHELNLTGYDNIAGFTFNGIENNTLTNASSRTAHINFAVDNNYNEPELSSTFNWEVKKASVNFENVKWGYIDADGVEHEFGPDGAEFVFTRDADKNSVKYTVALINIPSYLKNNFRYVTDSYTDTDFRTTTNGSFSAIGEYHTEAEFTGIYNGDTNHASFSALDIPANIPMFLDWEIKERELNLPEYDGSWVVFDNKVHDAIAMSGISEDELNYFDVEITYLAMNNALYNDYAGFNGVPYALREAGHYTITFYKLLIKYNTSTREYEDKVRYAWGQVEIDVEKEKLTVTWDKTGNIPVARVKGLYVSDMVGTKYYIVMGDSDEGARGAEASLEYVKSTKGEIWFEAEPYLTEAYANNLTYVMGNGEVPVYRFTYEQFTVGLQTQKLEYPKISTEKYEYTGKPITFSIGDWNNYKKYLYIVEGEEALTKTDVGVYHVTVGFIKGANACWKNGDEDSNRISYVLEFEIYPVQKIGLDKPTFNMTTATYTGNIIKFEITNWLLLQNYVDYVVTYKGAVKGTNIKLEFSDPGIYAVTFTFKDVIPTGYWVDDPTNKELTVQLKISNSADDKEIYSPVFKNSSKQYTGSELTFEIENWDSYFSTYLVVDRVSNGVTYSGGTFRATAENTYTVVFRIKTDGYTFGDGTTTCTVTFKITSSGGNTTPPGDGNKLENPQITGSNGVYRIINWDNYKDKVDVSFDRDGVTVDNDGLIRSNNSGEVNVSFKIKDGVDAEWRDSDGDSVDVSFVYEIPGKPVELTAPTMEVASYEYTGYAIDFKIKNWSTLEKYLAIGTVTIDGKPQGVGQLTDLTQTNVGRYDITLVLRDASKAYWAGNDATGTRTVTFWIVPASVNTSDIGTGQDGKPVAKNGDGSEVKLDDYLVPHYYDPETGEEVPSDALEDGKTYNVKYTIKNEEEFKKNFNNSSEIEKYFETHEYSYTYTAPADDDMVLVIAAIVEVVILVILVIATMVVLAAKKKEYEDDDADNYDDDD